VELLPAREVRTLEGHEALVLGAPLYTAFWHKDAARCLSRHRDALAGMPVAIFALGPLHNTGQEWQGARDELDQAMAKFPWLTPVALEVFGGRYDPALLRFPDSLFAKLPASPLKQMPATDLRDWIAIRAWGSCLAAKFQPAHQQEGEPGQDSEASSSRG